MPLVPSSDIDSILFETTVTGTGDITWAASDANVDGHRVPPPALNGLTVGYKMTHISAGVDEFENGSGLVNTTTRTLVRTDAAVTARSSGAAGTRHSFSAGPKQVAITVLGARLAQMATAAQDGLMTSSYAAQVDNLATGLAYEPVNF